MKPEYHYVFKEYEDKKSLTIYAYKKGSKLVNKIKDTVLPIKSKIPLGLELTKSYHSKAHVTNGVKNATKNLDKDIEKRTNNKPSKKRLNQSA